MQDERSHLWIRAADERAAVRACLPVAEAANIGEALPMWAASAAVHSPAGGEVRMKDVCSGVRRALRLYVAAVPRPCSKCSAWPHARRHLWSEAEFIDIKAMPSSHAPMVLG